MNDVTALGGKGVKDFVMTILCPFTNQRDNGGGGGGREFSKTK